MINPQLLRWAGIAFTVLALLACVYAKGRHDVQVKFNAYRAEVKAVAAAQEAKTRQIEVKNAKATQQIEASHRQQLAILRSHYAQRLPNSGTSNLSKVSIGTARPDGTAADHVPAFPTTDILAAQCAETTLALVGLQTWVEKVSENSND